MSIPIKTVQITDLVCVCARYFILWSTHNN